MKNKKSNYLIAAIVAVLCVGFCVSLMSVRNSSNNVGGRITLPKNDLSVEQPGAENNDENLNQINEQKKFPVSVSAQNIANVVKTLNRPQNYSYEIAITYFGENEYVSKILRSGFPQAHIISGKEHIFTWITGNTKYYVSPKGNFSADDLCSVPTYEDIIGLKTEQITDVYIATVQNSACLFVSFSDADVGYNYTYCVSADNGILLFAEAFDSNGDLVFRADVSKILTDSVSREILRLCDNKFADDYENENQLQNQQ